MIFSPHAKGQWIQGSQKCTIHGCSQPPSTPHLHHTDIAPTLRHTPTVLHNKSQQKDVCILAVETVCNALLELSISPFSDNVIVRELYSQCVIWDLFFASSFPIHPTQLCYGQRDKPACSHQENQPIWAPDVLPAHTEGNQDPAAFPPWEYHRHQRHSQGTAHWQHEGCVSFNALQEGPCICHLLPKLRLNQTWKLKALFLFM